MALRVARQRLPNILVPFLPPKLLKPLLTLATDPAACEMHHQIAVAVSHVIASLDIGIELPLRVNADVVPYKLVFQHQVLERVLLCAVVLLAHEHGVIRHHLQRPSCKGRPPEEGRTSVYRLVVLCDEDVNFLDAEVLGGVDVCRVLLELAVEDRGVAHEAAFQGGWGQDFVNEVVVGGHDDDVGVDEPDPLGVGVEVEGFGDGGDFGPCLRGVSKTFTS